MQKKIEKDISNIFTNVTINKHNITHKADKTGKSKVKYTEYLFKNGFENTWICDIAKEPIRNLEERLPEFPEHQFHIQDRIRER